MVDCQRNGFSMQVRLMLEQVGYSYEDDGCVLTKYCYVATMPKITATVRLEPARRCVARHVGALWLKIYKFKGFTILDSSVANQTWWEASVGQTNRIQRLRSVDGKKYRGKGGFI